MGWDPGLATAFGEIARPGYQPGRVVAVHRGAAAVRVAAGEVRAILSGVLRDAAVEPTDFPVVGDWVAVQPPDGGAATVPGTGEPMTIRGILPRKSAIVRRARDATRRGPARVHDQQLLAANVDVAFVVDSFDAGPNLRRLERYLALARSSGVQPAVLLNKADLVDGVAAARARAAVEGIAPDTAILLTTARRPDAIDQVRQSIGAGRTAVVIGPSGVGKSTIVNGLLGEERQATGAVRADDRRGRHTTTVRQLFLLPGGGMVIDSPGIRGLELAGDDVSLDQTFTDIAAIARGCRFADCRHEREPGCEVRRAVEDGRISPERLANARKLQEEARTGAPVDADQGERKRRAKLLSRAIRQQSRLKERG
jgi:ribosome biogenesis GTPase